MRRYTLTCPHARYADGKIFCMAVSSLCGNQRFCRTDGIMKLTDNAKFCPIRKAWDAADPPISKTGGETNGKDKSPELAGA